MKKKIIIFLNFCTLSVFTLNFISCISSTMGFADGIYGETYVRGYVADNQSYSYKEQFLKKIEDYQSFYNDFKIQKSKTQEQKSNDSVVYNIYINDVNYYKNWNSAYWWRNDDWLWNDFSFYSAYYYSPYRSFWGYTNYGGYDPYWHYHYLRGYNRYPYYFYGGDVYYPNYQPRKYAPTIGKRGDTKMYESTTTRTQIYGNSNQHNNIDSNHSYYSNQRNNEIYTPNNTSRSYYQNSNPSSNQGNFKGTRRSY